MRSVLTVMAMLISVAVFAQAGEKNFIDKNYIGVTDKSKLEFTPDKIYIQVLLSEKDKQGRNSVAEQEQKMLPKLQNSGVDIKMRCL